MDFRLMDYMNWRGDLTFDVDPFHEVDALALSAISYVEFDQIVMPEFDKQISFKDAGKMFFEHLGEEKYQHIGRILPPEINNLFVRMSNCDRYMNLKLSGYVNYVDDKNETQFAAITVQNGNREIYVIFRGTDDTITGWKEDFNLAFMDVIPAQKEAALYLRNVLANFKGKVSVMGHSKGGNLAVYSAYRSSKAGQKRIKKVYSFDGPGFSEKFFAYPNYINIDTKTVWYLPIESVVGTIMNHGSNEKIISSSAKGAMQHNPLTWEIDRNMFFTRRELSQDALNYHQTIKQCMDKMDKAQRKQFVDIMFEAIEASNVKTLSDIKLKNVFQFIDSVKNLDAESKELVKELSKMIYQAIRENH